MRDIDSVHLEVRPNNGFEVELVCQLFSTLWEFERDRTVGHKYGQMNII